MSSEIDITDLDKAEVLAALYNASKQQGMGFLNPAGSLKMTVDAAREYTDRGHMNFDYLHGRVMKVDISGDSLWVALYDRDNGNGAALRAITPLLAVRKMLPQS